MDAAGVPAGVFNMVQGQGSVIGAALSQPPRCRHDLASPAPSRSACRSPRTPPIRSSGSGLELGGKSAWVVLDDAATGGQCRRGDGGHDGQFRADLLGRFAAAGARCADGRGDRGGKPAAANASPSAIRTAMSRWVRSSPRASTNIVQDYIQQGHRRRRATDRRRPGPSRRARQGLLRQADRLRRPPTTWSIAREEIFGPVLVIIGYDDLDHAVAIANDTDLRPRPAMSPGEDLRRCRARGPADARPARSGSTAGSISTRRSAATSAAATAANGASMASSEYLEVKAIIGHGA